jgi:hypothetical protein
MFYIQRFSYCSHQTINKNNNMTKIRDNQRKSNKVIVHKEAKYAVSKNAKKIRSRAIANYRLDMYIQEVFEDEPFTIDEPCTIDEPFTIDDTEPFVNDDDDDIEAIDAAFDYLIKTVYNFVFS